MLGKPPCEHRRTNVEKGEEKGKGKQAHGENLPADGTRMGHDRNTIGGQNPSYSPGWEWLHVFHLIVQPIEYVSA